jgi:hypothetical protein
MCPTSSDEPGSSGSSDISNTNENSLSLGTCLSNHLDQASLHQSSSMTSSQTLYIPIASPPTPSPSPGPITHQSQGNPFPPLTMMKNTQNSRIRRHFLSSVVNSCTPSELLFISQTIGHLLKRDFLYLLPPELSLHILRFIDEPKTLVRASQVSKHWWSIVRDESVWKRMCLVHGFDDWDMEIEMLSQRKNRLPSKSKTALVEEENLNDIDNTSDRRSKRRIAKTDITKHTRDFIFSYRRHFRTSYVIRTSSNTLIFSFFLASSLTFRDELAKRRHSSPFTSSPYRQPTPWNRHFLCIESRVGRCRFRRLQDPSIQRSNRCAFQNTGWP